MNEITTEELMKEKMEKAGYTCKEVTGHRDYPGTPYYRIETEDCRYLTPGKTAVCDKIDYPGNHYIKQNLAAISKLGC